MEWNSSRLQDLIADLRDRNGDSTDVEVKAAAGGCPNLGETLCAFANMPDGGTLILGLDESAGFVPVGLTDIAGLEQSVASQARTAVDPPVRCEFQTFQVDGKAVLLAVVEALPLKDRPARHGGLAYLRQSDGDYVMSEQEIAQVDVLKTQAIRPTHPDRQPVAGTSVADLDANLLAAYLSAARTASRRYATMSDEQVLLYSGVLTRSGELTLAGLYALGISPQTASPSLGVTCAVQLPRDEGLARTRDLTHLLGPVPDLLDDAMSWVARNTRTTIAYDDRGHGIDRAELPMRAVREIIANALVHRNLDSITDSKRVEIRLLHDRLVITSPGGLWGVSESQLGRPGAKSAVNPVLYEVCKSVRMPDGSRVIEGEGGGIREAIEALRSAGLRPPHFVDKGIQFSVIISRHTLLADEDLAWLAARADADLSSEERAILASMRHGEMWNNTRVRQQFAPLDSVAARRMLQRLVDTGLAEAHGERGGTYYAIAPRHAAGVPDRVSVEEVAPSQPALPADDARPATVKEPLINAVLGEDGSGEMSRNHEIVGPYRTYGPRSRGFGSLDPGRRSQNMIDQRFPKARPPGLRPTRHAGALLAALEAPATIREMMTTTGLSEGQVRFALRQLMDAGEVTMQGAQGVRGTRYTRS